MIQTPVRRIKADLHNHLKTGGFPIRINTDKVIDITSKKLGPGGTIAVINFDPATRYEDLANSGSYERDNIGNGLYFTDQDVTIVKGVEVEALLPSGKEVDILGLGVLEDKHPKHGRTLLDCMAEVREMGGIIGAGHPFHMGGLGPYFLEDPSRLLDFDFVEIHNGECALSIPLILPYKNANEKAQTFFYNQLAETPELSLKVGKLISSDGHSLHEIGNNYMEIPELDLSSPERLAESLRTGLIKASVGNLEEHRTNSYFSAIEHIMKWAYIKAVRKSGLGKKFPNLDAP